MKAYVAMSGGVDSSVCAYLMKQRGYDCTGLTFRLIDGPETEQNIKDAASVCEALGIPHEVADLRDRFKKCVIERFISGYENVSTPNPCIECNRHIKFSYIPDGAVFATGHYARIGQNAQTGRYEILRAADINKDQSYVLYSLSQDILSKTVFPLGDYTKPEIREIAVRQGFASAGKHDSQDICFVPSGDYASYIEENTGKSFEPGAFTDVTGKVLGYHRGLIRYTVGQRKGLGLALPAPMYVCGFDIPNNRVILGTNEDLFTKTVTAGDINLVAADGKETVFRAEVKLRYAHKPSPALVTLRDGKAFCTFDEPQRAPTNGQALVAYSGDRLLFGGTIE